MKAKLIATIFLLIASAGQIVSAQTLPPKIKSYLNAKYKGWKISPLARNCTGANSRSVVAGDFNGDGKTDYAAKIVSGKRGFFIGFLAEANDYKPHLFHALTAAETDNMALILYRKGEKYYTELGEEDSAITLETDAPYDVPCESDAGDIHIYRNGRFENL